MLINRRNMMLISTAALVGGALDRACAVGLNRDDDAPITALVNQIRHDHGVQPLTMHKQLRHVAQLQVDDMAKSRKFRHHADLGHVFPPRQHQVGAYAMAVENIAAGQRDVPHVLSVWMLSDDHRRNLLNPDFAYYGLASATSGTRPDYPYWALVLSL